MCYKFLFSLLFLFFIMTQNPIIAMSSARIVMSKSIKNVAIPVQKKSTTDSFLLDRAFHATLLTRSLSGWRNTSSYKNAQKSFRLKSSKSTISRDYKTFIAGFFVGCVTVKFSFK